MVEFEINIETWEICVIVYLVFGLAPTMTIITSLVVGWLYGKVETGLLWGLGVALISSPAGLITFMLTAPGFRDKEADLWNSLLYGVVPYVITGIVFSAIAARLIVQRVHTNKPRSE